MGITVEDCDLENVYTSLFEEFYNLSIIYVDITILEKNILNHIILPYFPVEQREGCFGEYYLL